MLFEHMKQYLWDSSRQIVLVIWNITQSLVCFLSSGSEVLPTQLLPAGLR